MLLDMTEAISMQDVSETILHRFFEAAQSLADFTHSDSVQSLSSGLQVQRRTGQKRLCNVRKQ